MQLKGHRVIDLITGEWHGRTPGSEYDIVTDKGRKPLIRKIGFTNRLQEFPLFLDKQDNMFWVDTPAGGRQLYLVPNGSIPNFSDRDLENSVYRSLFEKQTEESEDLRKKLEEKDKKIGKWKKKYREAVEEEEEDKSSSSSTGGSSVLECGNCLEQSPRQQWLKNNNYCPKCNEGVIDNAVRM